jgi:hypothetical protein
MTISVLMLLTLVAFLCAILAAIGRAPVWIPVLLLTIILLLMVLR